MIMTTIFAEALHFNADFSQSHQMSLLFMFNVKHSHRATQGRLIVE